MGKRLATSSAASRVARGAERSTSTSIKPGNGGREGGRERKTTPYPASRRDLQIAAPMPELPPVTRANSLGGMLAFREGRVNSCGYVGGRSSRLSVPVRGAAAVDSIAT